MVGTSFQSRIPMTGASRRPDHCRHASSRAWSTFGAAGRGRGAWLRRNGRAAGRPRKSSVRASLYAEPAGVSALYSVIRSRPSAGSKNASSRDTGVGAVRGSSRASARPSSRSGPRAGGRRGVVFGDPEPAVGGVEERVEPGHRGRGGARLLEGQRPLVIPQAELIEEERGRQRGAERLVERAQQNCHPGAEQVVLPRRKKAGPEHGAERPVAEEEPAALELAGEPLPRLRGELRGQAVVPRGDRRVGAAAR